MAIQSPESVADLPEPQDRSAVPLREMSSPETPPRRRAMSTPV